MRKLIITILSIALIVGVLGCADTVLKDVSIHGVKQCMGMYDQPRDTIDVLVLGSSHVHYGINTAKLWEDFGIAAYDYSSAEQSLWVSYYYLKEALKTQNPKVVVLDFFSPAAYQDNHKFKYTYLNEALYGMKFSFNKICLMKECFDDDIELWNKFFPSFFGYHDRYKDIKTEDFKKLTADYSNFKGFTPHFNISEVGNIPELSSEVKAPSDTSVKYLQKIVDYTAQKGIKLYITTVPYQLNIEQTMDNIQEEDKRYNYLEQYVAELTGKGYDHVFFDYIFKHLDDVGLDFENGTDFDDGSHLNYYGSCKYSIYLGNHLRSLYSEEIIPDRRGDIRYVTWDNNAEELKKEVEENGFTWID